MKIRKIALAVALTASAASAQAVTFTFGAINQELTGIDFGPSSFLAQGGNQAVANFAISQGACPNGSCDFSVLYHAKVSAFLFGDQNFGPDLTDPFEFTVTARFTERVVGITGGNDATLENYGEATFQTVNSGTFFQLFYDVTKDSNQLTGSGFNDGRLILSGTSVTENESGSFKTSQSIVEKLDGANGGQTYDSAADGTQNTLRGNGLQNTLTFGGFTIDSAFFSGAIEALSLSFENIGVGVPFGTVNPSHCFTEAAYSGAVGTTNGAAGNVNNIASCDTTYTNGLFSNNTAGAGSAAYLAQIGDVNGAGYNPELRNPDFVAQADTNANITGRVPEPGSLALMAVALGALSFAARRNGKKA